MQELIRANSLEDAKITAYHIGFVLGPCINASGRLDTAARSLALLNAKTKEEAARLAGDLTALNQSRKALTEKGKEEAIRIIETTELKNDRVLVVYLPDCHESLAGIIAGRIREKYHRPAFVLTGGETSAGAAASGFFLTLLCLLAQALTAFVPPILECYLALSMACCITEQSCLGNLCKAAGILLQKGLSLTGKLLAALLGFQRISAAQLDRTALRTGQFLTGTIPIVGQSLSDASEAVLAGIQLLKSGLGMAAILILLAEFLPLYLGMLAHLGCIVLCGTLCSLTGNNRGQALLTCFASAVRCMMACIALFFGLAVTGTALLFMLGGV